MTAPAPAVQVLAEPLDQVWRFFRLTDAGGQPHLFYRCPGCGATLDWRDHDTHLIFHGVTDPAVRAEIINRQERYAGVQR
jgi:hypothetical protein